MKIIQYIILLFESFAQYLSALLNLEFTPYSLFSLVFLQDKELIVLDGPTFIFKYYFRKTNALYLFSRTKQSHAYVQTDETLEH